tara:strand:+ start:96 stop:686 length:591 start_codon:yes stop_codon:yes gene_type:complete
MFNGIIKSTGKINKLYKNNKNCSLYISTKIKFKKNEIGSSVSCSGACLTLEEFKKNLIKFYISKETLNKTTFKFSKIGDIINLEKPLKFGERVSGHFVQGHVDTTAIVKSVNFVGKSWLINFKISKNFTKHLIQKGSITVNGVSLTIAKIIKDGFLISVIPKTLKLTNLANLKTKDIVNIEFDVLGKYIKKFLSKK